MWLFYRLANKLHAGRCDVQSKCHGSEQENEAAQHYAGDCIHYLVLIGISKIWMVNHDPLLTSGRGWLGPS